MSRNISVSEYNLPVGVIIGKNGSTINYIKFNSGARISVKEGNISISGGHKQVLSAKALLKELASNFQNGIVGFNHVERPVRMKRPVVRVSDDGWKTTGEMKKTHQKEPTRNTMCDNRGQFAGLDFSDSDDDSAIDEPTINLNIAEKTTHPTSLVGLDIEELVYNSMIGDSGLGAVNVFAKMLPKSRSYEEINADIEEAQLELVAIGKSWADEADRQDTQDRIDELTQEKEQLDKIQDLIQNHPDM